MSLLEIVQWPAKVLETRAEEVRVFDKELQDFVKNMHKMMDKENGIGLAANQVNVLKRVIVIFIPFNPEKYGDKKVDGRWWHNKRFTFVNPTIVEKKGAKVRGLEGCLSFPEIFEYVERASEVVVHAYDEFGKEFSVDADGLFSICLQHEIDHIDGVVFTERMSRLKATAAYKKLMKRKERAG